MKTIAVVQARMGSTRFPNKVMRSINGRPMIELLLSRLAKAKRIDQIVTATSGVDDLSNTLSPTYPDGLHTEVFSFRALKQAAELASKPAEREHVMPFIRESGPFKTGNFAH